jgi:nucleoid DNA-binding protein
LQSKQPNMMTDVLVSYLLQHKSISIPGLGSMYIERIPAQTDFVNRRILPPDYHFRFDKYFDAPDKDFFTYLAKQQNIADYEAIKWYNEWAYELRSKLREGHTVEMPGIGTLKKDISGEIVFESAGRIPTLQEPTPANRVIHSHSQHKMLIGEKEVTRKLSTNDNYEAKTETVPPPVEEKPIITNEEKKKEGKRGSWWFFALVVAAIALSLIIFRFAKNGFNTGATGNHQTINAAP